MTLVRFVTLFLYRTRSNLMFVVGRMLATAFNVLVLGISNPGIHTPTECGLMPAGSVWVDYVIA